MLKLRKGTFETNSSSSHSLVYSKKNRGYTYDLPVDDDGVLTIPFGEFGWGPQVLKDPIDKLSYVLTDRCGYKYYDISQNKSWEEIVEELKEDEDVQNIIDIIKTYCDNVKDVTFETPGSYYPTGYVDHQSRGTSNDDDISEIIFNNNIIILIDNDNSCCFEDYFDYYGGRKSKKDIEELFKGDYND